MDGSNVSLTIPAATHRDKRANSPEQSRVRRKAPSQDRKNPCS
jgi:hypothetical protein